MVARNGWPGKGQFKLKATGHTRHHHIVLLEAEAFAGRTERQFRLPLEFSEEKRSPKRGLVDLLTFARQVQAIVYEERQSVEEIARRRRRVTKTLDALPAD